MKQTFCLSLLRLVVTGPVVIAELRLIGLCSLCSLAYQEKMITAAADYQASYIEIAQDEFDFKVDHHPPINA